MQHPPQPKSPPPPEGIAVFIYTAWDGYAWQGCDANLAEALENCILESGTKPRDLDGEIPFGGIRMCLANGGKHLAVFRYHIRKNGDALGRDSLYLALALVPFPFPSGLNIDLAKLFAHPFLAQTRPGKPEASRIPYSEIAADGDAAAQAFSAVAMLADECHAVGENLRDASREAKKLKAENTAFADANHRLEARVAELGLKIANSGEQQNRKGEWSAAKTVLVALVALVLAALVPICMVVFKLGGAK